MTNIFGIILKDYYIGGSCVRVQVGSNQRSNQRLLHWWIMCSSPGRVKPKVKPKTITLVFAASSLRSKNEDWLVRHLENISKWSGISTRGLLFQWATEKIQSSVLV